MIKQAPQPLADLRDGRLRRCRASACCSTSGSPSVASCRCAPRATASRSLPRGDPARRAVRRADLRRSRRQGDQDRARPPRTAPTRRWRCRAAMRRCPRRPGDAAPEVAARRDLRRPDSPGNRSKGTLPDGGALPRAAVAATVELDEIFRTFDDADPQAFQTWMQSQAAAVDGPRSRHQRHLRQPARVPRGQRRASSPSSTRSRAQSPRRSPRPATSSTRSASARASCARWSPPPTASSRSPPRATSEFAAIFQRAAALRAREPADASRA